MPFDSTFRLSDYIYTNSDRTAERVLSSWVSTRAVKILEGKKYWEIVLDSGSTSLTMTGVGVALTDFDGSTYVGGVDKSCGYYSSGYIYRDGGSGVGFGGSYVPGDTIGVAFDQATGNIFFAKNGVWLESGNPETGENPAHTLNISGGEVYRPFVGNRISQVTINEKPSHFNYTKPLSYESLGINLLSLYNVQIMPSVVSIGHVQKFSMAPRLYHQVTQIMATARRLNLASDQVFDTAIPLHLQHEQVFHGMTQVALAFTQVFRGYGPAVALEFIQSWVSHDYNLAFLPFVQLIGSQIGTVLQEIQFSVTIAGVRVGVIDCQFDRDDFCQIATLTLADKRDYDNKQIFDNVVITVYGEQFRLIVVDKPYDEQIQQGSVDRGYIIECASITCQLSESINDTVRATRITASFPAGAMAGEILAALTDGICSASLNVTDFPTGGYDFEDAVRIDALRQVFPEGGDYPWIIETDGDGVLQISSWEMPEFGGPGQKTLQFRQKQLTPPEGILYTQVSLKNYNQGDGQTGLTLEVVDNGDGTGTIYGYSVPWTDAFSIFDSEDSTAPSLLITGGSVEEVEVEDTDVEFVDYAASLSKPCYSSPVIDWGNNDSLSPVTYTESGALTTATEPGYSAAVKFTYTTRRKVWTYDNRKIDVSQVRLKYD